MRRSRACSLALLVVTLVAASACAVDLGTHDGSPTTSSWAEDVAADGPVVGRSGPHAFIQHPGRDMELLTSPPVLAVPSGDVPTSLITYAHAVNGAGTVIGSARSLQGPVDS